MLRPKKMHGRVLVFIEKRDFRIRQRENGQRDKMQQLYKVF